MDPSRNICVIKDSFKNLQSFQDNFQNNLYDISIYENKNKISPLSPRVRRKKLREINNSNLTLEHEQKEQKEQTEKKNMYYIPDVEISSAIFNKFDIILANIDAVYNFSGQEDGYLKPQIIKEYDYVSLGSNKEDSYLLYLQYRLPAARGFLPFNLCSLTSDIVCSRNNKNNNKNNLLDERNLNISDEKNIVDYVIDIIPQGVNLVVSSKIDYQNNLETALKLCKPGGIFISRINETLNDDLSLYYITANCFEKFSLFKPISESLNEPYSYVIAENYKGNSMDWISLFKLPSLRFNVEHNLNIPEDFIKYLNDYYLSLENLKEDLIRNPVRYDPYKCKAIWNIF